MGKRRKTIMVTKDMKMRTMVPNKKTRNQNVRNLRTHFLPPHLRTSFHAECVGQSSLPITSSIDT